MSFKSQSAKLSRARRPHALIGSELSNYGNMETETSLKRSNTLREASSKSRPALAERSNIVSPRGVQFKPDCDMFYDSEMSSDGLSSDPTTPGDVVIEKTLMLPTIPSSIHEHPALSPSRRSCSGSVTLHDIEFDNVGSLTGFSDQAALAWDNNRPFTDHNNGPLDTDHHVHDLFYPAHHNNEGEISPLAPTHASFDTRPLATVKSFPMVLTHDRDLSPFEQMRRNIAALEGGDAVFSVQLDIVMDKLVYALTDLDSAYLFRDFAGHFAEFLDRFGPGGYDSHRAPDTIGWIINLLLPLLHADVDASENRVRVFAEVSCWLQRIIKYLGFHSAELILNGGPWERCAELMSSTNTSISLIAFGTAEVIMRNVPLEYNLVLRVLFLQRPLELDLGDTSLTYFRLCRVKLLSVLLERIDQQFRATNDDKNRRLVSEIMRVLDKFKAEETDLRVSKSIDLCMKYARDTEALFSGMAPSQLSPKTRRPHLSLTIPRWQQLQLDESKALEPERKPRFLTLKWFLQHSSKKDQKSDDAMSSGMNESASIKTSKSTTSVLKKWHQRLSPWTRNALLVDDSQMVTEQ